LYHAKKKPRVRGYVENRNANSTIVHGSVASKARSVSVSTGKGWPLIEMNLELHHIVADITGATETIEKALTSNYRAEHLIAGTGTRSLHAYHRVS
jgi:hypothetical protein